MATNDGAEQAVAGREELMKQAGALLEQADALKAHYRELSERLEELAADAPGPVGTRPHAEVDAMRKVATNLFLTGSSREQVASYLAERFGATDTDTDALLDECSREAAAITHEFHPQRGRRSRRRRFRRGS
jgi:hypothetical protein